MPGYPSHPMPDVDEDPGFGVHVPVLVRATFQGSSVAMVVTVPRFATWGREPDPTASLHGFLRAYVGRLPGRSVAAFSLPRPVLLEEVDVPLVPLDVPPKLRKPIPITFPCVVVPVDRDRWVLIPTLHHAVFVGVGEDLPTVVRHEIGRLVAARDLSPYDRLALLPGRAHALETLFVPLDGNSAAAKDKRRALSDTVRRKLAAEVLDAVAVPMHVNRDDTALSPLVGREQELETLHTLLSGETRSGVLVLGPAGVGKTALIRAWIKQTNALVYRTSGARLVAGMGGFGQWEERVQQIASALDVLDAVLLLEDLEDVLAERVESGGVDLAGGLAPYLDAGKIRLLTEVRDDRIDLLEQRAWSWFASLTRVGVTPLDAEATLLAMRERNRFEREQDDSIPPFEEAALSSIVELTRRYAPYDAFPGKAVALFRAVSRAGERRKLDRARIGRGDVMMEFSRTSGIPSALLVDEVPMRVEDVAAALRSDVVGQEPAVRALAETLAVIKAGLQAEDKPLATFLFVGPTGVGKTELARSLAKFLFGAADRLVRFDMSEFMTVDAAERLIRGTDLEDGLLTRRVREQPFCVVLLDEIEKADSAVFDLLLQVCGEGRLTDARGQTAYFHNTLVIMTSNLGAREHRGAVGFAGSDVTDEAHYARLVQSTFRPEMVNRIDRIVPFGKLSEDELEQVGRLLLRRVSQRPGFRDHGIALEVTDAVVRRFVAEGYDDAYGARGLRRHVEQALVVPIARLVAALDRPPVDGVVTVRVVDDVDVSRAGVACGEVTSGPFVFSVARPKVVNAARIGHGFREIASLRREADRIMRCGSVEEVRDQVAYLVALLGRSNRSVSDARSQQDAAWMLGELKRLQDLWEPVRKAQEDLRAIEELAVASVLDGQPVDTLVSEAWDANRRLRAKLPYVMLALEERRNAVTLVLEELDEGAFDPWLVDLLVCVQARRWDAALHVHGEAESDAGPWGAWGPPRTAGQVLETMRNGRTFRSVVLRCRGPFAGVLLGLEAGLHTMIEPPHRLGHGQLREQARVFVHFVMMDFDVPEAQFRHRSMSPPRPSTARRRKKAPPARDLDWPEQRVRVLGKAAEVVLDPDQYWAQLDRVALAMLLVAEADDTSLSREHLFLPAISPDEAE